MYEIKLLSIVVKRQDKLIPTTQVSTIEQHNLTTAETTNLTYVTTTRLYYNERTYNANMLNRIFVGNNEEIPIRRLNF